MQNRFIFSIIIILIFGLHSGFAQNSELRLVHDENGQALQFANVCWQATGNNGLKGNTISDTKGIVTLGIKAGSEIEIRISCVGCIPFYDTIQLESSQEIRIKEDVLNLEQVTITGTRTQHTLKEAPVLTQLVSSKEIERVDVATISDILETEVPGIEMGRHGYGKSMSVQGLDPQYTLILIDGERMAGETGGNVDYSRINAANVERVEIVRGASSALYGSNAMGGVVNIITKKPKKKVDVAAGIRYAQVNQKNYNRDDYFEKEYVRNYYKNQDKPNINGNLRIGFRNKKFYTNTFGNYKSYDGYRLYDREGLKSYYSDTTVISPLGSTTISGFEDYTVSNKTGYNGDKLDIEVRANLYQHEEFPVRETKWVHDLFRSYTLGGSVKYKIREGEQIQIAHNFDIYDKYDVFERKSDSISLNYRNIFQNTRLNYTVGLGDKHVLFMGIENLNESLETDMFVYDGSQLKNESANDLVLIAQDEFTINKKFNTVIGLRAGYHSTFNFHASPTVTLKYDLSPVNLRVNYARGYRSPTLKELYLNWSHMGMFQLVGSTKLKPETNDYFAVSADYLNPAKTLNFTLISSYNQIHDKIDGMWTNDSTVSYLNLDRVRVVNIEGILKYRISEHFNLKGGYVFTRQIKDDEIVALSEVSPHALTTQLEYIYSNEKFNLSANINGKFLSKKNITTQNSTEDSPLFEQYYELRYPGYSLWNLTVNFKYGKHVSLSTGLKNIFNYTSPTVTMNTTPSIGRRYFVSLMYKY
jgi:outer membrane receptor for ferrienterochelin and colicins